jgi:putative ABC transport system substrate-binding protein
MRNNKIILITIVVLIAIVSGTTYAQDTDTYTVAVMVTFPTPPTEVITDNPFFVGVKEGFAELGYVEGETITYLYEPLFATETEKRSEIAQAFADAKPDVIVVLTAEEAFLFKELTSDIPIVFGVNEDPVAAGLVEDLLQPGGNITGIEDRLPDEGRLQIMKEIDPSLSKVYYPYNPQRPGVEAKLQAIIEMAEKLDIEIVPAEFTDPQAVEEAIKNIPEDIDGIFLTTDPLVLTHIPELASISVSLQAMVSLPSAVEIDGVLVGYGIDVVAVGRQAAQIADRILRGADPAVTAVEPAEHSLLVNLEVAAAINLEIPRAVLRRADIIIRPGDQDEEGQGE